MRQGLASGAACDDLFLAKVGIPFTCEAWQLVVLGAMRNGRTGASPGDLDGAEQQHVWSQDEHAKAAPAGVTGPTALNRDARHRANPTGPIPSLSGRAAELKRVLDHCIGPGVELELELAAFTFDAVEGLVPGGMGSYEDAGRAECSASFNAETGYSKQVPWVDRLEQCPAYDTVNPDYLPNVTFDVTDELYGFLTNFADDTVCGSDTVPTSFQRDSEFFSTVNGQGADLPASMPEWMSPPFVPGQVKTKDRLMLCGPVNTPPTPGGLHPLEYYRCQGGQAPLCASNEAGYMQTTGPWPVRVTGGEAPSPCWDGKNVRRASGDTWWLSKQIFGKSVYPAPDAWAYWKYDRSRQTACESNGGIPDQAKYNGGHARAAFGFGASIPKWEGPECSLTENGPHANPNIEGSDKQCSWPRSAVGACRYRTSTADLHPSVEECARSAETPVGKLPQCCMRPRNDYDGYNFTDYCRSGFYPAGLRRVVGMPTADRQTFGPLEAPGARSSRMGGAMDNQVRYPCTVSAWLVPGGFKQFKGRQDSSAAAGGGKGRRFVLVGRADISWDEFEGAARARAGAYGGVSGVESVEDTDECVNFGNCATCMGRKVPSADGGVNCSNAAATGSTRRATQFYGEMATSAQTGARCWSGGGVAEGCEQVDDARDSIPSSFTNYRPLKTVYRVDKHGRPTGKAVKACVCMWEDGGPVQPAREVHTPDGPKPVGGIFSGGGPLLMEMDIFAGPELTRARGSLFFDSGAYIASHAFAAGDAAAGVYVNFSGKTSNSYGRTVDSVFADQRLRKPASFSCDTGSEPKGCLNLQEKWTGAPDKDKGADFTEDEQAYYSGPFVPTDFERSDPPSRRAAGAPALLCVCVLLFFSSSFSFSLPFF